jgi:AbrB family looped-hinge helix DNA binding protein
MPKIQEQKSSLVTTIPKEAIATLGLKQGDYINFNVTGEGKVEIVKIKEEVK